MCSALKPLVLALVLLWTLCASGQQLGVRQVTIHSGWGGLGTPQRADILIQNENGTFRSQGKPVEASLVNTLASAVRAAALRKPEASNLGISASWLRQHLHAAEQDVHLEGTARQERFFDDAFTSLPRTEAVLPALFNFSRTDDYPGVEIDILLENGSKLTAETHSQYVFMTPWEVAGNESYNADISRAVAALLPPKTVNKERLAGAELESSLAEAVMREIEPEWKLIGVEDRAGPALAALKQNYAVEQADINPYHNVDYGVPWNAKGPHETNLHATLHQPDLPPNFNEELVLLFEHESVDGVQHFLQQGKQYEQLVLSVPWFAEFIRQHPKETVFLKYVHQTSFSDQAMRTFALDMKARGREDLIPVVRAQQASLALLKIGFVYWIVFPDKHMMLWRFEGPRGFLKWKQSDFPAGRCGAYQVNDGGCSGREITADGELIPEHGHRDEACVAAYRRDHRVAVDASAPLFPVMDHGRGGFIDTNGVVRIPLCFDTVSEFSEGLARFERDSLWGYIDQTGTVVIDPQFPWAEAFSEGLARVQVSGSVLGYDGRWGFIDKTGSVVIKAVYARDYDEAGDAFHGGLAKVQIEGKSGYIDHTGRVVIPATFSYAYPFSEGLAAATQSESGNDGWGYIDRTGHWAIPPRFEWASSFQEGLAPVNRKHNCGYIDKQGAFAISLQSTAGEDCAGVWGDFSEGLSRQKFGSKYGFINRTGATVIAPAFDLTFHFSDGLAAVQIAGKWGYIDQSGMMVIPPKELSSAKDFHNGLAEVVTKDGRWGYIDRKGKDVWAPTLQGSN